MHKILQIKFILVVSQPMNNATCGLCCNKPLPAGSILFVHGSDTFCSINWSYSFTLRMKSSFSDAVLVN